MRKVKENLVTNQIHILTPTESCFRLQPSFNFKGSESIPSIEKKSSISPLEAKALTMEYLSDKYPDMETVLACDGSKTTSRAAAAFMCQQHLTQTGYRLPDISSSYFAENLALLKALEHLNNHHPNCTSALILTDSRSTIEEINNLKPGSFLLPHMQKIVMNITLFRLTPNVTLYIQWVPSHVGVLANETVDKCAREACLRALVDPTITIPSTQLKSIWAEVSSQINLATHRERQTTGGSWTSSFLNTPTKIPWYHLKELTNKIITRTNRILIGHANNRLFQCRLGHANTPHCRYCNDETQLETVEHVLSGCRTLNVAITRIIGEQSLVDVMASVGQPNNPIPQILDFLENVQVQI
ncbi:hypothetical protein GE061_016492 [Apolygus lucorum]|uniref:RNase H type-1 domain-containing protein n=1 Tax=Apolygus lucorum TaxID=248454 RepID=A0A8S9XGE3_APOLU|nr:hypothetical protein GE061_016492 [Apolygus lucorum]